MVLTGQQKTDMIKLANEALKAEVLSPVQEDSVLKAWENIYKKNDLMEIALRCKLISKEREFKNKPHIAKMLLEKKVTLQEDGKDVEIEAEKAAEPVPEVEPVTMAGLSKMLDAKLSNERTNTQDMVEKACAKLFKMVAPNQDLPMSFLLDDETLELIAAEKRRVRFDASEFQDLNDGQPRSGRKPGNNTYRTYDNKTDSSGCGDVGGRRKGVSELFRDLQFVELFRLRCSYVVDDLHISGVGFINGSKTDRAEPKSWNEFCSLFTIMMDGYRTCRKLEDLLPLDKHFRNMMSWKLSGRYDDFDLIEYDRQMRGKKTADKRWTGEVDMDLFVGTVMSTMGRPKAPNAKKRPPPTSTKGGKGGNKSLCDYEEGTCPYAPNCKFFHPNGQGQRQKGKRRREQRLAPLPRGRRDGDDG
jgi:hypothetical protein